MDQEENPVAADQMGNLAAVDQEESPVAADQMKNPVAVDQKEILVVAVQAGNLDFVAQPGNLVAGHQAGNPNAEVQVKYLVDWEQTVSSIGADRVENLVAVAHTESLAAEVPKHGIQEADPHAEALNLAVAVLEQNLFADAEVQIEKLMVAVAHLGNLAVVVLEACLV